VASDGVCHPAVYVLASAVLTLEREWDDAAKQNADTVAGAARRWWAGLGRQIG
jgi:hypothetical protein